MKATVELYEPLHEHLKTRLKYDKSLPFKWVVVIGPIVVIKPSERSAHNYLTKLGFVMDFDNVSPRGVSSYLLKYQSEDEKDLELNYEKVFKNPTK